MLPQLVILYIFFCNFTYMCNVNLEGKNVKNEKEEQFSVDV